VLKIVEDAHSFSYIVLRLESEALAVGLVLCQELVEGLCDMEDCVVADSSAVLEVHNVFVDYQQGIKVYFVLFIV